MALVLIVTLVACEKNEEGKEKAVYFKLQGTWSRATGTVLVTYKFNNEEVERQVYHTDTNRIIETWNGTYAINVEKDNIRIQYDNGSTEVLSYAYVYGDFWLTSPNGKNTYTKE